MRRIVVSSPSRRLYLGPTDRRILKCLSCVVFTCRRGAACEREECDAVAKGCEGASILADVEGTNAYHSAPVKNATTEGIRSEQMQDD
jgi:hypothetical protein